MDLANYRGARGRGRVWHAEIGDIGHGDDADAVA
jgi:hypothetical protein